MTQANYLEDEIDLRGLFRSLLRYKWWIIGVSLLAAVITFGFIKFLIPKQYTAVALVMITKPVVTTNLDPRVESSPQVPDPKALSNLALTDDIFIKLSELTSPSGTAGNETVDSLKHKVNVTLVGTSQLRLDVTDRDPVRAALIVNQWARLVAERINWLAGLSQTSLDQMKAQAETAKGNWASAEQALIDALPENKANVIEVTLPQAQSTLKTYLSEQTNIDLLIADAQSLDARLTSQTQTSAINLGDAVSLIGLQQRSAGGLQGFQFQLTSPMIIQEEYTVADALKDLRTLVASLQTQRTTIETEIDQLEQEIITLGTQLETEKYRLSTLTDDRDLALNAYQALSSQVEETSIALSSQENLSARVVGLSSPPEQANSSRTTISTLIAGLAGFFLSAFVVLVLEWWKAPGRA